MTRPISVLSHIARVVGVGAGGGFALGFSITATAMFAQSARAGNGSLWTSTNLGFAAMSGVIIGIPVGILLLGGAYISVLRFRLAADELVTLGTSTFLVGVIGSVIAIPLGMFTAVVGFVIGCLILAATQTP